MTERLAGHTVVLIGGSAGIGLETARRVRAEGAEVILVGRDPDRLKLAAADVDARRTAAVRASPPAGGNYYARLAALDSAMAQQQVNDPLFLPMRLARAAIGRVRPPGSL